MYRIYLRLDCKTNSKGGKKIQNKHPKQIREKMKDKIKKKKKI